MYKIEKNVKILPRNRKIKKYPFENLEIGDSFLVKCTEDKNTITGQRIRASFGSFAKYYKSKIKITIRAVDEGMRTWRTE